MTDEERTYLEDTLSILVDYDGYREAKGLMFLIDETMERIGKVLEGKINEEDTTTFTKKMSDVLKAREEAKKKGEKISHMTLLKTVNEGNW